MSGLGRPVAWLVRAHPRLESFDDRQGARLFALLMLVHVLLVAVALLAVNAVYSGWGGHPIWRDKDAWVVLAGLGLIVVAYGLVRSGFYRGGVVLYILVTAAVALVAPFVPDPNAEIGLLASAAIPALLAAMVFPPRWVLWISLLVLLGGSAQLLASTQPARTVGTGVALLIVVSVMNALVLILRRHWTTLERYRVAQLQESEERFRLMVKSSSDVLALMEADGTLRFVSDQAQRVLGFRPEELAGRGAFEFVHPDDVGKVLEVIQSNLAVPDAVRTLEYRNRHADGRWVDLEAVGINLLHDPRVRAIVVNVRDVTARKRAQEALAQSEARYRGLFETITDAIVIADQQGRIVEVNQSCCRQLGYSREELLALSLTDLSDRSPQDVASLRARLLEGGSASFETMHRRKDGSSHPVELAVTVIRFEGKPAFMGVARDITERTRAQEERRRLEEQLQQAVKMESIGLLAGGVAHDFNNLLTAIKGNLSVVLEELGSDHPAFEPIADAGKAADSAASLVRQLLAFSRRQPIEPRVLDLNLLIENMHKMLLRLIGEDVLLQSRPGRELGSIRADPGLVEQVIVNLAVNARDAMPDGGTLTIETANAILDGAYCAAHPLVAAGSYVVLTVSDTGTGMAPEVLRHLFEPFFTTKPKGRGTGLGLATTYGSVKQSGGHIDVESAPGRGTAFKVFFPRADGPAAEVLPSADKAPGGTETVLVVEDEESVRSLCARVLGGLGYQVLVAAGGPEAIRMAAGRAEPIHLLLTDVVMPLMNGRQLARRIAELHPEARVLFTSGYAEDAIAHHGVLEPGLDFIAKPYQLRDLAAKVRQVLDAKPAPGRGGG